MSIRTHVSPYIKPTIYYKYSPSAHIKHQNNECISAKYSFFLSLDLSWALLYDSLLVLRQGVASFNHTEAWDPSNKVSCREEQVQNKSNC